MLKRWWKKFIKNITKPQPAPQAAIYSSSGSAPTQCFALAPLSSSVRASSTGPDAGVRTLLPCLPDFAIPFNHQTAWACGQSTSLYDATPGSSGVRAGDPIADCFAIVAYEHHTVLAVADGVNWGEPAKRAARSAVLGAVAHLHKQLPHLGAPGAPSSDTSHVFERLIAALEPAQKLIIAQFGTMTTLVITVVARLALPLKHSTLKPSSSPSSTSPCYHWAAMTLTVGDSSAYVYRQAEDIVEDLTGSVHAAAYRDPRWTPGALGYAAGEEPDLSNMTCSLTLLNNGDLVFLTSDGVADNFDPFMLKLARQAVEAPQWGVPDGGDIDEDESVTGGQLLPTMDAKQSHVKKMELLTQAVRQRRRRNRPGPAGEQGSCPLLPAQDLVQGLLEVVNDKTAAQRKWAERKHMAKEHEVQRRSMSREMPSLNTDTRGSSTRDVMPPGKMDHATIAALMVGAGS